MLIAIDPGANLGWAVFDGDGSLLDYGTHVPDKGRSEHARRRQMKRFITGLVDTSPRLKTLVVEANMGIIHGKGKKHHTSSAAVKWLVTTYCTAMEEAERVGAEIIEATGSAWRKRFLGSGRASKDDTLTVVNERFGLRLASKEHNAAEAIGMGAAYCNKL